MHTVDSEIKHFLPNESATNFCLHSEDFIFTKVWDLKVLSPT